MQVRVSTGFWVGLLLLASIASAADLKKYGLELRGGMAMPAMEDITNQADTLWGAGTSATAPGTVPSLGISLLYRTHEHFMWEIGYNTMTMSSWESTSGNRTSRLDVSGSEFFILPTYFWHFGNSLKVGIGAGPNFAFAKATRGGDYVSRNFPEATGRVIGSMVKAYGELSMGQTSGLVVSAGYRDHYIDRLRWEDDAGQKHSVQIGGDNSLNLPIDYSGAFVQVGWRFYFQPGPWGND